MILITFCTVLDLYIMKHQTIISFKKQLIMRITHARPELIIPNYINKEYNFPLNINHDELIQ